MLSTERGIRHTAGVINCCATVVTCRQHSTSVVLTTTVLWYDTRRQTGGAPAFYRSGDILVCYCYSILLAMFFFVILAIVFYGTEAFPITSADKHSLEFTTNKVLYKIVGAISEDFYGDICKYFGIAKVEESIRHRKEKIVKRYSGYSNSLCHSISARL